MKFWIVTLFCVVFGVVKLVALDIGDKRIILKEIITRGTTSYGIIVTEVYEVYQGTCCFCGKEVWEEKKSFKFWKTTFIESLYHPDCYIEFKKFLLDFYKNGGWGKSKK